MQRCPHLIYQGPGAALPEAVENQPTGETDVARQLAYV